MNIISTFYILPTTAFQSTLALIEERNYFFNMSLNATIRTPALFQFLAVASTVAAVRTPCFATRSAFFAVPSGHPLLAACLFVIY